MDTTAVILAVATPAGHSARGILRISGQDCFSLLSSHISPTVKQWTRQARPGRLIIDNLDLPVMMLVFPPPGSYTGEPSVELQLAGNPTLLERCLNALIKSAQSRDIDARRAEPGEFTARAFFNGKLTLTEAEGVAATIAARSDAELRAAQWLYQGELGRFAQQIADDVLETRALLEAGIDFTDEEDVRPIDPEELQQRIQTAIEKLEQRLSRCVGLEQLQAIPWVVITGPPNAGKSTLFNTLLDRQRAVVSSQPGATRDVLTAPLTINTNHGPAEVMLVDLAGTDDPGESTLNRMMQEAAATAKLRAELIIQCVPADQQSDDDFDLTNTIIIRTKSDLLSPTAYEKGSLHDVSAHTGQGVDALRTMIAERLADRAVSLSAESAALQPRHEAALRHSLEHLKHALNSTGQESDEDRINHPELIAADLHAALDALALLTGETTADDILDHVFATFCIGK